MFVFFFFMGFGPSWTRRSWLSGLGLAGGHWFEELALYAEGLIHRATLTAKTFCEVLTLESEAGRGSRRPGECAGLGERLAQRA